MVSTPVTLSDVNLLSHTLVGDPAAEYVIGRSMGHLASQYTYGKVKEWLKNCDEKHNCRPSRFLGPNSRPTFLVDVNPDNGPVYLVRLHKVGEDDLEYAALSYCWGTKQPAATYSTNLKAYLSKIDLRKPPRSLRDAIWVTRKLNLKYLWIDSLCILQDDEDAKSHEIGKMKLMYGNAYVIISADSAQSCGQGFLKGKHLYFKPIDLPFRTPSGHLGSVKSTCFPGYWRLPQDNETYEAQPIHNRASTFQENFMSHRILAYSTYKIFWVCSQVHDRDGGIQTYKDYSTRATEIATSTLKSPLFQEFWEEHAANANLLSLRTLTSLNY